MRTREPLLAKNAHQLLIGASPGDAITSMARAIQTRLQQRGESHIYAAFIDPSIEDCVRPIHDLYAMSSGYALIYHASYGLRRVTDFLLSRQDPLIINYHNITPAEYFADIDPEFADGLRWGREELHLLVNSACIAVADSTYNARELENLGYQDVMVCPAGVSNDRLTAIKPDIALSNHLTGRFRHGYVVALSQLLPHKCVDEVISAVHISRTEFDIDIGLVVVGVERSGPYSMALRNYARDLLGDSFWITGRLNDRQVATILHDSLAYVSMSRHEGLSLPLIEAMACGTPAIVREAGAIAETAGGAAIVLSESDGAAEAACEIRELVENSRQRTRMAAQGYRRSLDFDRHSLLDRYIRAIEGVLI